MTLAGRGWVHRWRCLEKGCPEAGEGEAGLRVDKEAERHTVKAGHATSKWAEPPLPIKVQR